MTTTVRIWLKDGQAAVKPFCNDLPVVGALGQNDEPDFFSPEDLSQGFFQPLLSVGTIRFPGPIGIKAGSALPSAGGGFWRIRQFNVHAIPKNQQHHSHCGRDEQTYSGSDDSGGHVD